MRFVVRSFFALLGLALALLLGLFLYLQNANHLKPELEALIAQRTGVEVTLAGDVSWQLWPPVQLSLEDVTAVDGTRTIHIQQLALKTDVSAFWQDMDNWRIDDFHLTQAQLKDEEQTIIVTSFDLNNFALNKPADLNLTGSVQASTAAAAYPFTIEGTLTYSPATTDAAEQVRFSQTTFSTAGIAGVCDLDVRDNPRVPAKLPPARDTDLLPLEALLTYDVIGDCLWQAVTLNDKTFEQVETKITNIGKSLNLYVQVPEFFSGSMITEVDVNLASQPIKWHVMPELTDVDSKTLLAWSNRSIDWTAIFATHSDVKFTGNSMDELYSSVSADSVLQGEPGQINIAALKKQLANVALLTRKGESVADWPDVWNYQNMVGNLQTRGQNQSFDFVVDHLKIDGNGKVNYATDAVDMLANVTISAAPEGSPYRVNPILQDTPLPFRCRGPGAEVKCKLDEDATKNMIARALRSDDETGLRRKLEQKIEDDVPEEYREAAKSLLDVLGRALEDN